jgi:DNA-binding response OmpR family regulator
MRRIRVVDDDRHTRLAIGIWLKQCGFRVAITDGGESGLSALNEGTFDLMIVDAFMPNMRGFESIRVFHSHAPTVPLIAISGYAFSAPETDDPACFRMALSLGATRCLRKPFRPATLLAVIDECLSEAAPKICRGARRHCGRAADHFEREGKYGLKLPGRGHAAFAAFVDPDEVAEVTGTSRQTRKTRQPRYDCDRGMID